MASNARNANEDPGELRAVLGAVEKANTTAERRFSRAHQNVHAQQTPEEQSFVFDTYAMEFGTHGPLPCAPDPESGTRFHSLRSLCTLIEDTFDEYESISPDMIDTATHGMRVEYVQSTEGVKQSDRKAYLAVLRKMDAGCEVFALAKRLEVAEPTRREETMELYKTRFVSTPTEHFEDPYLRLKYYILKKCRESALRIFNGTLYEQATALVGDGDAQVALFNGHWRVKCGVADFIDRICAKGYNFDAWKLLNAKGNASGIYEKFEKEGFQDEDLPLLEPNRFQLTIGNGVYNADELQYLPLVPGGPIIDPGTQTSNIIDEPITIPLDIVNMGEEELLSINSPRELVELFLPYMPSLMQLVKPQMEGPDGWSSEGDDPYGGVLFWLLWAMGRMLYPKKFLDKCDVCAFILGAGGSGKSTLIEQVICEWYMDEYVGVMESQFQKQFGMQDFLGKYIVVGTEINAEWTIPPSTFKNMVSGGRMSVSVKGKGSEAVKAFDASVFLAGNSVPNTFANDIEGAFRRRLLMFPFLYAPPTLDQSLPHRLFEERGNLLIISNMIYHYGCKKIIRSGSIVDHLPKIMKMEVTRRLGSVNPLVTFLDSSENLVVYAPDKYVPTKDFMEAYSGWRERQQLGKETLPAPATFFTSKVFVEKGVRYVSPQARHKEPGAYPETWGGKRFKGSLILGIDLVHEDEEEEQTYATAQNAAGSMEFL